MKTEFVFEEEFKKATTITALQEFLRVLKLKKIGMMEDDHRGGTQSDFRVLDEQAGLVEWELKKLRSAQQKGRFRAYNAFLKTLDEHYPLKTPVLSYKYILEDGVNELTREILSNMLHLPAPERN